MERTESSQRQQIVSAAEVIKIDQLSTTVKGITVKISEKSSFTFKPGQWVDFFAPGFSTIGGFSICSTPKQLKLRHSLSLAIKYSEHPPAFWAHTKCKVGDKVQLRVGGDFYYEPRRPEGGKGDDVLLVAGGVGINPLFSMMQHVGDIREDSSSIYSGNTSLLFSAQSLDELLFKEPIINLCSQHPAINCTFFVTKEKLDRNCIDKWTKVGRITKESLRSSLSHMDHITLRVFICGPPNMTEVISDSLVDLGIENDRIRFEKWW